MVDLAKYESLISDLSALESQVEILRSKYNDTLERNKELEVSADENREEKNSLHQRISELELEAQQMKQKAEDVLSLNPEEREELKNKIRKLISVIDNHLSSESTQ